MSRAWREALLLASALFLARRGYGQCAETLGFCTTGVGQIHLNAGNSAAAALVDTAVGYWSGFCEGMNAVSAPVLSDAGGDITFDVYYVDGPSTYSQNPDACGLTSLYEDSGAIAGGQIIVWSHTSTGAPCQSASLIIDHEVGHALGLADLTSSACSLNVMYASVGAAGLNPDECDLISNAWYTPQEQQRDSDCTSTCRGACYEGHCGADECFQLPDGSYTDSCYSPIVIDLEGRGYHLTSAEDGVRFDLNSDGTPEAISWPRDGANAFLCIDRNRNGRIDSGRELFGNYTMLADGELAHNGFAALAEYDTPAMGGNGNGQIESGDGIWLALLVWRDSNHDGVSQPAELQSLDAAGVVSISLHYVLARRIDGFGNAFRYRGTVLIRKNGGAQPRQIYDIFFVPLQRLAKE